MFPLSRFRVADDSMRPTLLPGDYVLVNRWAYAFRAPGPGDIIVFRHPRRDGMFLIKRIASVDGAGRIVVSGDNAAWSEDSRTFGPVGREALVGRVIVRTRP